MNDTQKMLQAIIHGQNDLKQELVGKIDKVERKVDKLTEDVGDKIKGLDQQIDRVDKKLTKRLDNIGRQLAYLEDDTPTREEYNNLEKRVDQLEQKVTSAL